MPRCPVSFARTANLPLIEQPGGMFGSSGKRAFRTSMSRIVEQLSPSSFAVDLFQRRRSCGVTKQPFHSPTRLALACSSSAANRPLAGFEVYGPALSHEPVVQCRCFPVEPADTDA